jgi:hypothetical protein
MRETKIKPWICSSCAYEMDTMAGVPHDATPIEGDIIICLNCAAVYELDWQLRPQPSELLNPVIVAAQEIIKRGRIK